MQTGTRKSPPKVYLAASYLLQAQMREVREGLGMRGIEVTSRWIDDPAEQSLKARDLAGAAGMKAGRIAARQDLEDIDAADCVIVFTEVASTTGGMHAELGYALGRRKNVIVCGARVNVFQCLVDQYPGIPDLIAGVMP